MMSDQVDVDAIQDERVPDANRYVLKEDMVITVPGDVTALQEYHVMLQKDIANVQ